MFTQATKRGKEDSTPLEVLILPKLSVQTSEPVVIRDLAATRRLLDKIPKTRFSKMHILKWRLDELNWYRKAVILTMIILGFGVLWVPSVVSEPNLRGLPTIPIALFISALALYAVFEDRRGMLYAMLIILLLILGYSGFWVYSYKMPLSSLEVSMRIHRFSVGFDPSDAGTSIIESNVTILNPTNVNTPPFAFENLAAYVNDMRLTDGCEISWGRTIFWGEVIMHEPFTVIRAHGVLNMTGPVVFIYQDRTQVEKGSPEDVWNTLSARNFTLTITGTLTSRPSYEEDARSSFSLWILAASPFKMSQRFSGS